jgi:hypothetical protein
MGCWVGVGVGVIVAVEVGKGVGLGNGDCVEVGAAASGGVLLLVRAVVVAAAVIIPASTRGRRLHPAATKIEIDTRVNTNQSFFFIFILSIIGSYLYQ